MQYQKKHVCLSAEDIAKRCYDAMALVDPLWWSVSIYDGLVQYEADLKDFSAAQRAAFAIMWLDAEVNNGGFDQFFVNSTGIVWKDALTGFRLFGMTDRTAIMEHVLSKWGGAVPFDRTERQMLLLEQDSLEFDEDDRNYYRSEEDIDAAIMDFAAAHPEEFTFEGDIEVPTGFTS